MTLDEAIIHEKELSEKNYLQGMLCHANPNDEKLDGYIECGRYHEQISEWLEELKMYKSLAPKELVSEKQRNDRNTEYIKGFNSGYNKAIDDFMEKIDDDICNDCSKCGNGCRLLELRKIAEQLKAGTIND